MCRARFVPSTLLSGEKSGLKPLKGVRVRDVDQSSWFQNSFREVKAALGVDRGTVPNRGQVQDSVLFAEFVPDHVRSRLFLLARSSFNAE